MYMHNKRQKKVLELGCLMFPVPHCTQESHVFAFKPRHLTWMAAFKHLWPSLGLLSTKTPFWLCVGWTRDRAVQSAFVVVKVTQLTLSSGKYHTRGSTLCHSFMCQHSESTRKQFIQHFIKAPLKGWTESTMYTELSSRQRTGAVQGVTEKTWSPEESLQDGFPEGTVDEGIWSSASCYCGNGPALGDSRILISTPTHPSRHKSWYR